MSSRVLKCVAAAMLASLCPITPTPAWSAAASMASAKTCSFGQARYRAVDREKGSRTPTLDIRRLKGRAGLAAVMRTSEGPRLDFDIVPGVDESSHGIHAVFANIEIASPLQAFGRDLKRVRLSNGAPAPEYLLMPELGFEAQFKQRGRRHLTGVYVPFSIPDGIWRLVGCGR